MPTNRSENDTAAQTTIVVGGAEGWVVKPGNAPYEDIVASVGDTIQFTYRSSHDVMLVDNTDCDFGMGEMMDETGDFAWVVTAPGTYIFACSRSNHCAVGNQQVTVVVGGSCVEDIDSSGIIATFRLTSIRWFS